MDFFILGEIAFLFIAHQKQRHSKIMLKSTYTSVAGNLFLLFIIGLFSVSGIQGQFTSAKFEKSGKAEYSKRKSEVTFSKIKLDDSQEKPHTLVGGYYNISNPYKSKLLLNNKGGNPIEVQPTLYGDDGRILPIAPVIVEGQSYQFFDIADWARQGGADFNQGNIELFHRGNDLVIGSQIYITNEAKSIGFENKLGELGKFNSRQLEGVWWNPSNSTETDVALTNTSDELLTVTANLTRKPNITNEPQTITLLPHQTKVLNVRNDFNQGNIFANKKILGLTLKHEGKDDALLAWAMTKDESSGYSNIVTFTNPASAKSKQYHGAGLRLGNVGNDKLKPIVVVRNTSNKEVTVKIKIPYTKENDKKRKIRLEPILLAPKEIHKVNMQEVRQLKNVEVAGIEIKHSSRKGSIVSVVQSVSQSKTHVFRTLLWDILGHKSSTGDYPVDISGTSNSVAYIKNATNREQEYLTYLIYGNQEVYTLGIRKLAPDETIKVDIRKLRDEQIPDIWDKTLPANLTKAQISWTGMPSEKNREAAIPDTLGIIGQMSIINEDKGINSAYFCESCCVGTYEVGTERISPQNKTIIYGDQSSIDYDVLVDVVSSCYPTTYVPTPINASWTSGNSSIGTFNGDDLSIQGAGKTTVQASFQFQVSYVEPCGGGGGPLFAGLTETKFLKSSFNSEEICNNGIRIKGPNAEMADTSFIKTNKRALAPGCGECNYSNAPMTLQTQVTIKPKITIKRDGNDITSTSSNQNIQEVIVGQRMNMTATVEGGSPSSQSWTLSANSAIKEFKITPAASRTPDKGETVDPTDLNTNATDFIWYKASSGTSYKEVKHEATVRGATNEATANFNVKKPTATLTSNGGTSKINNSTSEFYLGGVNATIGGVTQETGIFVQRSNTMIPKGFQGEFQYVQLITAETERRPIGSPTTFVTPVPTSLDGCYPYNNTGGTVLGDKPGFDMIFPPYVFEYGKYEGNWSLYLMFRPTGTHGNNADWVPIKKLNWSWTGEATINSPNTPYQWSVTTPNSPGNPNGVDTTEYPTWMRLQPSSTPC